MPTRGAPARGAPTRNSVGDVSTLSVHAARLGALRRRSSGLEERRTSTEASRQEPRWLRRTPSTLVVPKARLGDGGIRWAAAEGFYRGKAYLTGYDPSRLSTWSGLFVNRDLTLFAAPDTWRLHLFWVAYSLALALLVTFADERQRFATAALGLFEGAVVEFRTLTAFVLGGFVLLVVGAWRERRAGYTSICSATKALLVTIAATVPLKAVEERRHLGRWVTLAFELAVLKARGHGDSKPAREFLEDSGLAITDEWEAMEPSNRETTVFFWINLELKNALSKGTITVFEFTQLVGQVTRMRDAAHDLMGRNAQDMPYPYASMIGLLVQMMIVLQSTKHALLCAVLYPPYPLVSQPVAAALATALAAASNTSGVTAWPEPQPAAEPAAEPEAAVEPEPSMAGAKQSGSYTQVDGITGRGWGYVSHMWFLQLGCLFLWNLIYHAFFNIQRELHSPYGTRRIDLAHEPTAVGIRKLAVNLMDHTADRLPPALLERTKTRQRPLERQRMEKQLSNDNDDNDDDDDDQDGEGNGDGDKGMLDAAVDGF